MNEFKVGLCFVNNEGDIVANKILESNWTVIPEQDLPKHFNSSVTEEIATILFEAIQKGLTKEVIKEMLKELKEGE